MSRLICTFVVRLWHKTHFLMAWLISNITAHCLVSGGRPHGQCLRMLIFSALNHSSSHHCGFEPSLVHIRQAKFCLQLVRCFFSGIWHFLPALRLTPLKMSEIILMGPKTQIKKKKKKFGQCNFISAKTWLTDVKTYGFYEGSDCFSYKCYRFVFSYLTSNLLLTGADMDVCLGQFGQCNFISAKHAFIFYDEVSANIIKNLSSNFQCSLCDEASEWS